MNTRLWRYYLEHTQRHLLVKGLTQKEVIEEFWSVKLGSREDIDAIRRKYGLEPLGADDLKLMQAQESQRRVNRGKDDS